MISQTKETFQFDRVDYVVSDIAKGRIVIVTDDADRENEGDLVMAAEKVTPKAINFMFFFETIFKPPLKYACS